MFNEKENNFNAFENLLFHIANYIINIAYTGGKGHKKKSGRRDK